MPLISNPVRKIFVHGLSGGVGVALLSLGRIQGAQVFGTASLSKHEELRKLGAVPFVQRVESKDGHTNGRTPASPEETLFNL